MGIEKSVIGLGILGIVAYLWFRNKGDNVVPQNNPIKEIEFRNIQQQEASLTKELITDIDRQQTLVNQTNRTIAWLQERLRGNFSVNNSDVFVRENARRQKSILEGNLGQELGILQERNQVLEVEKNEANQILINQNFYNSATLNDIRQRLNSSEFSGF